MKSGNKNTPLVRFNGFSDAWEQRKWFNTVNMSTNMVDPKTGKYDDLPHIGPGNIESFSGRILDNIKSVREDNLISGKFHFNSGDIIYGKINPQLAKYAYVNFEGLTSADTYVLKSHNGITQEFLFVILQTKEFYKYSVSVSMRTGMPKINRDELNQYNYLAPSNINEQKKIGGFFKQLDSTIALHQRKLDILKQMKKGFLQQLFPKNEEKVPRVRFANFDDEWELRKLTDIVIRVNKSSSFNGLPKVEFEDISAGEGRLNKDISNKMDNRKGTEFEPEDVLYGKLRPYLKNWLMADFKGIALGDFWVFRAKESIPGFIYSLIQADKYQRVANDTAGTKMPRSDWKKVSNTDFLIPKSIEEQKKIGLFFKQLDDTIALHQNNVDKLSIKKKAYLQTMFV